MSAHAVKHLKQCVECATLVEVSCEDEHDYEQCERHQK